MKFLRLPAFVLALRQPCLHGLIVLICTLAPAVIAADPSPPLLQLKIRQQVLTAEVAANTPARTVGLMNRFSLKPDHGMLFVFREPQPLAFWMKNTYIPLSIAFIDATGRITNIEDMSPQAERTHHSAGLALYALEMKQGWFRQRGIRAGDFVDGLEKAPKAPD